MQRDGKKNIVTHDTIDCVCAYDTTEINCMRHIEREYENVVNVLLELDDSTFNVKFVFVSNSIEQDKNRKHKNVGQTNNS